jgi:hypothetical protein
VILIPDNDMDATDLAFLDKFMEMEKHKDTNGVDPEGVEEARDHHQDSHHDDQLPEDAELIQVEWDMGDMQTPDAGGESSESDSEAEGQEGQGEEGDQDGEGEGESDSEGNGESDSDSNAENDESGDESDESESSECDGDCDEDESKDDAPPCPYCTEKEKRQQENLLPENADSDGNPMPIALDHNAQEIFVGSEIVSSSDADIPNSEDEYVGVVLGRAYGFEDNPIEQAMIVVLRRDMAQDSWQGSFMVSGETNTEAWGVQSDFTEVIAVEKSEPEPPPEPEAIFHDENGTPLYDGDQILVTAKNRWRFPEEGIATLHATSDEILSIKGDKIAYPCFTAHNWELSGSTSWTFKGKLAFTFSAGKDPLDTITGIQKLERRDDEEPEQDEQDHEYDFEDEEKEEPRKPMTKAQMDKFRKLCAEVFDSSHDAFGDCNVKINDIDKGPELPGGIFDGEEIARTLELTSGKVTYRVTFSAERCN